MSDPCVAEAQDKEWYPRANWIARHEELLREKDAAQTCQVAFLGDSITEGWRGEGQAAWAKHLAPFGALNLGIGGDETSHVLWRIEHGALDGIQPKVLVLLIGTNNVGNSGQTGVTSARGVKAVVAKVRQKLPRTRILLLAVFPRGEHPEEPFRQEVQSLNRAIATLHDGNQVHLVDLWQVFLAKGEILPRETFPDSLHLSAAAYELLATKLAPKIAACL